MKLKLLLITFLFFNLTVFSQTNFLPGYYIQENGTKINCLIKNEDWIGNPKTFEYKFEESGELKIGSIANISEFGAGSTFKYIRATMEVDQSTDVVNNLTDVRNPIMKEETLFLKTLAEGKASLYYTELENIKRYFFKIDDQKIQQLIYKRYMTSALKMGTNDYYKQQLATTLTCENLDNDDFENLEYKTNKLIKIISDYNACENSETILYGRKDGKSFFNLSIRPGVTFTSLSLQRSGDEKVDFGSKTGFRIGLEAEYIFPFNNSKWSLFAEPTYRNFKAEKEFLYKDFFTLQETTLISVEYNSIEVPAGIRHYMYINQDAAFFIDTAFIMSIATLDSKITSSNEAGYDLNVRANTALAFGFGFKYQNKYSLQARYHTPQQIVNYLNIDSAYDSFSLIVGYNFF